MNPTIIVAELQALTEIGTAAANAIALYQRGDLGEAALAAEWARMQGALATAVAAWHAAGDASPPRAG